jgi:hypothetical protein
LATQTPYYNLKKPAGADMASPTPFNENMDIIDTALNGKQNILTFDNNPTANSNNPVKSGGVFTALAEKTGLPKAVKYLDMEFEEGVAAVSFDTSSILGHTVTPNKTMVIAINENVSVSNVTAERIYLTRSSTTGGITVRVIVLEFN